MQLPVNTRVYILHRFVCTSTVMLILLAGCDNSSDIGHSQTSTQESDAIVTVASSDEAGDGTGTKASAMSVPSSDEIVFKDDVSSNVEVPEGVDDLVFVNTEGMRVALEDYLGQKNVVLVFTEGFSGMLCPFCKTQTSRLIANYRKFKELDTEILVVYPGERDHVDEFLEAARTGAKAQLDRVPFPVVLDQKMEAVAFFDIRSQLAHPATYVIDKAGNIRLAYVGRDMSADRPSVKVLLQIVKDASKN